MSKVGPRGLDVDIPDLSSLQSLHPCQTIISHVPSEIQHSNYDHPSCRPRSHPQIILPALPTMGFSCLSGTLTLPLISTHALSLDHWPSPSPRVKYLTSAYLCFDHCLLLTLPLDSGLIIFSPSLKLGLQPQNSLPTTNHLPSVQNKLFSLELLLCVAEFLGPHCYPLQELDLLMKFIQ